jgi:class 3 adenylate cyclase
MNANPPPGFSPTPDAELRLATLVKCDIVDSTRTWAGLDPSDGLALTRAFRKSVEQVVQQHGGHVERWEGDGALILFGYPDAREDAPQAAVRAGLDLAQAVRSVRSAQGNLEFRVGIASGAIAVDLLTKSLEGMTFNLAERLKTTADPGQVVIDDSTRRLAESFFEYQDLGMRPAKGFEHGVQAWRVVRETAVVSRFDAHRFGAAHPEIVGRSAELAALAQAWSAARAGSGQVMVIVGEAGVGKSRLARAVVDKALRDGAMRVDLDCMPGARNSPLFPFGVWLRRAAGIGDRTLPAGQRLERATNWLAGCLLPEQVAMARAALAPLLLLPAAEAPADQAPEALREASIAAILQLLHAHAARGLLLVLCEDLHWSDDTTATVLQRFAAELRAQRVLLVATARSAPEIPFRREQLGDGYGELFPGPLSAADAGALVRNVAQGAALAAGAVGDIVRRCEGLPLILEEVTRGMLEAASAGDPLAAGVAAAGSVPAPLQLVVESRLERSRDHKLVAQAASVLGRVFSLPLLEQLLPGQAREVRAAVSRLAENGLLALDGAAGADHGSFTHAMIRDAVYHTLLRDDRRELHSRVADQLRAGDVPVAEAFADELAGHLCEAGRYEESIEVRLAASADTVARGAYVETEGHCEAGLRQVDHVTDAARRLELKFRLLVQLGVALTGRHGYSAAQVEGAYRRARDACGETAHAGMLYPIMRGLTAFNLVGGKLAAGYELSLQCKELAEQSAQPAFRIDAMSVHCYATLYYRSLAECRSWIQRCLALYREEGGDRLTYPVPNDAATAALAILPTVEWLLGDAAAAEEAIRAGLRHVDGPNRDFDKAYMHAWIAGIRFTQRRYAQSRAEAQLALEIAQRHGYREWFVTGFLIDRLAHAAMEPAPEALKEAYDTCIALAAEGVGLNASWYLWALARGYRVAGQDAVAAQLVEQAFARAAASAETRMDAELLMAKAELAGDDAAAAELLRRAVHTADEQQAVANALRAAAMLVLRVPADGAARELARATLDLLEGRGEFPESPGWMAQRLGQLRITRRAP